MGRRGRERERGGGECGREGRESGRKNYVCERQRERERNERELTEINAQGKKSSLA